LARPKGFAFRHDAPTAGWKPDITQSEH